MKPRSSHYNEVFEDNGTPREAYAPLMEIINNIGKEDFSARSAAAKEKLRELGATFPLSEDPAEKERILPADWIPRIIPAEHWRRISTGVLQRGKALNTWLTDLYNGEQTVVPRQIVESSIFYRDVPLPEPSVLNPIHVYGPDLVHLGSDEYVVLEDNVRMPSGIAYSDALRRAGLYAMKDFFAPYEIADGRAYYSKLRASLESAAPYGVEDPCIAVVTRGKEDSAYFEHSRIAEACGIRLRTLADCHVEDGELRDSSDGQRIDVVYRRFDEEYIKTDLPGLEEVYREGRVCLANAPGVGVADDKAVFPYVPEMIRHYLDEKPILENAPTHSLIKSGQRDEALSRLDELVLKPREGYGGQGLMVGPESDEESVNRARENARENSVNFIAQEALDFSTHILGDGPDTEEAYIDLRAFVLPAVDYALPGGLTRVANPGTRVVNSSAGGRVKDTWVLEDR